MNKSNSGRKKRGTSAVNNDIGTPRAITYGVLAGFTTSILCCIISAIICVFSPDPDKLVAPCATISAILAHFAGGFFSSKKKKAPLPCGLATGGILAFIFWIISMFFSESYSYSLSIVISLLIRLSMIAVSVTGALLGGNQTHKRNRRRR